MVVRNQFGVVTGNGERRWDGGSERFSFDRPLMAETRPKLMSACDQSGPSADLMLCQTCKKREALIHLGDGTPGARRWRKHLCRDCADRLFARTPGMNSARDLIQLTSFYRSKLYDALEKEHPEAFDNSTTEACGRGSDLMRRFLRKRLTVRPALTTAKRASPWRHLPARQGRSGMAKLWSGCA